MSKVLVTESYLSDIADAIRSKNGETTAYKPSQMASAIESIESGSSCGEDTLYQMLANTLTEYSNDELTSLPAYAFRGCASLVSVSFPECTIIGQSAFQITGNVGKDNLANVNMPKLKEVGATGFYGCAKITELTFPHLKYINATAFSGCSGLTKFDCGLNNTDTISTYFSQASFKDCTSLVALILRKTNQIYTLQNANALTNTPIANGTGFIYVPQTLLETYKSAPYWSTYADQIVAIEGSEYE